MRRRRGALRACLACAVATLLVSAASAPTAGAAPLWYFNGEALEGSESMTSSTPGSYFTIPGLTFGCQPLPLEATIKNLAGKGLAEITNLPLGTCFTNSPSCTIEAFEAEALPWSSHLITVSTKSYLVIEGIRINFLFGGEECVLYETVATITGTAIGFVDNENEEIIFSGTELKAFGGKIEWNAALELRATGTHRGEALSAH